MWIWLPLSSPILNKNSTNLYKCINIIMTLVLLHLVVRCWLIYPYPSGLLLLHCDNLMIIPVYDYTRNILYLYITYGIAVATSPIYEAMPMLWLYLCNLWHFGSDQPYLWGYTYAMAIPMSMPVCLSQWPRLCPWPKLYYLCLWSLTP